MCVSRTQEINRSLFFRAFLCYALSCSCCLFPSRSVALALYWTLSFHLREKEKYSKFSPYHQGYPLLICFFNFLKHQSVWMMENVLLQQQWHSTLINKQLGAQCTAPVLKRTRSLHPLSDKKKLVLRTNCIRMR